MPNDATLTTTPPAGASATRPVPPSWASVAPLLARWQIALVPYEDGTWDVRAFGLNPWPAPVVEGVPFADLPQVIAALAASCEEEWR